MKKEMIDGDEVVQRETERLDSVVAARHQHWEMKKVKAEHRISESLIKKNDFK